MGQRFLFTVRPQYRLKKTVQIAPEHKDPFGSIDLLLVGKSDRIYIAKEGSTRSKIAHILIYDRTGAFLKRFQLETHGKEKECILDMTLGRNYEIIVSTRDSREVHTYSAEGEFLRKFSTHWPEIRGGLQLSIIRCDSGTGELVGSDERTLYSIWEKGVQGSISTTDRIKDVCCEGGRMVVVHACSPIRRYSWSPGKYERTIAHDLYGQKQPEYWDFMKIDRRGNFILYGGFHPDYGYQIFDQNGCKLYEFHAFRPNAFDIDSIGRIIATANNDLIFYC